jgi:hypothetical protein
MASGMGSLFSARGIVWIVGLIGIVLAVLASPWSEGWREVGPLVVVLALALIGLLGELSALAWTARSRTVRHGPTDLPPADGTVGIAPMAGVRSEPNSSDPRFRRFQSREPGAASSSLVGRERGTQATPPLLGRVVLISVFIGRDGHPWTDAEVARAHAAMLRAGHWLEREAIRWNASVNLDLAETYFVVDDDEPEDVEIAFFPQGETMQPFEAHAVTKALTGASRAAIRLGFPDAAAMIGDVNPRVRADARVWLLHPRQAGHSLAVPLEETELAGVSLAVCYACEANFPEPLTRPPFTDPVTIAHELLHLFGASDKYGVSIRAFPPKSVTTREIMRLDETSLSRTRIDPLTAREIGWVS